MAEMCRAGCRERELKFHAFPGLTTLPASPCAHQPGSSLDPIFSGFYKGFITQAQLIKSVAIKDSSPSALPSQRGGKVFTRLAPLATRPLYLGAFQSHLKMTLLRFSSWMKTKYVFIINHSITDSFPVPSSLAHYSRKVMSTYVSGKILGALLA